MSSPRDDDPRGDDPRAGGPGPDGSGPDGSGSDGSGPDGDRRPGDGGWQEPAHLGDTERAADRDADRGGERDAQRDREPAGAAPGAITWAPPARRPRTPGVVEQVFRYQGDPVGAQGWALQHGWEISDGTAPQDAVLAELVATAPVRATREHRPAGVMRGRAGSLELVAFDVVFVDKRSVLPEYAVTAAPVLLPLPPLRLAPARFWRHRTGGLLHLPSGDPAFDARWVLLAAEDAPGVRRLVEDATVRGLLLGSDDGDEFWTAAGHLAAVRPDGQRPELIEHHARLLGAMVAALAGVL
ncbi:hypothetical protein [Geodermatophilus sp. SYSU D00710]